MAEIKRAIFLDRDGVINHSIIKDGKPYPPTSVSDVVIIEGVNEALNAFKKAGFLLICVTNQPDVARGTQNIEAVESIHKSLMDRLPLDAIYVCYADGDSDPRRKPNPGMILEAAKRYCINLSGSFMVGDRWRDVDAGSRAGCHTIFIDYGYDESLRLLPERTVKSLAEAADWILSH